MAATKKTTAKTASAASSREVALETAISRIERDYGKGAIMRLGDSTTMNVSVISTGSIALDHALGIGGVPRGRIIEISGPDSSGTTTLALHVIAEVQKSEGEAAFIDAEHALDPVYAKNLGVDTARLLVSQPDCGEQALEIAEALVNSGAVDVIVVDSVAALVPRQEIDGDMGSSHVGLQARLMSQAMRKLAGAISKSNCTVIFINQLREKVGIAYGNPEVTTGGRALKFYASVRIEIRKTENLKNGADIYGNHVRCKIVKNKVSPPFKTAEFDILYGTGISRSGELLEMGVQFGIIEKSGSWFSFEGNRIGQGKDNARKYIESDAEVFERMLALVREKMQNAGTDEEIALADEDDFDLRDFDLPED